MTPPDSGEREPDLPCPHARPSWRICPHCLGINATVAISLDLVQRILAALESVPWDTRTPEIDAVEAELRKVMGK